MNKTVLTGALLTAGALCAQAATFYPIAGVTTNTVDFFAKENMIQGAGVGFDAAEPHDSISTSTWVTNNPNGSGDYYGAAPPPVLVFDLGIDVALSEMSTWGYADGNTNGAKDFTLRFATDAEGTGGFGTSIIYNPAFEADFDPVARDSNVFSETVNARYVEMTITDNWKDFQGVIPGGDRVGLGEAAFAVIPEPSAFTLLGLAGAGLLLRRKRLR